MVFLPRTDYSEQENGEIIESALLEGNYYIYGWRQVPINPSVRKTADQSRPEIAQVMFKKNDDLKLMTLREICLKLEKNRKNSKRKPAKDFIFVHSARDQLFTKVCS